MRMADNLTIFMC